MKNFLKILITIILVCHTIKSREVMIQPQAIIFDLGGVLLREAESNLHKSPSEKLQKVLAGQPPKIKIFNRAFEFATLLCGQNCKSGWIMGTVSGHEVVSKIKENIDKKEHDKFFRDQYERALIKHGIEFILLPDLLVGLVEVIDKGLEFIKKCKSSGIKLCILSNWDPESFELLKNKMPDFFSLFEKGHIVIPQMVGKVKPDLEIYEYVVKKLNLNPSQVFFVDDSKANVESALTYGLTSVLHKNWKETEQELINHGLRFK